MSGIDCSWFEATSIAEELDLLIARLDKTPGAWMSPRARQILVARMAEYRNHASYMKGRKPQ